MEERKQLIWKKELLETGAIFLIGALVNFIFWCEGCLEDYRTFLVNITISGVFWVMLWKGSQYMVWYLDPILPWIEKPVKRFVISLLSVVLYTSFTVYFLDFVIDVFIMGKSLRMSFQSLNYSSLTFAIGITLGINTIMHGRAFLLEWRQASINMQKLKTEQVFTQFQSLKNQVNPHFLFNSLNALSALVYEDQDKAVEFIRKLSQVYRYVLDKKDDEVVPVREEMDFLKNFIFLQKIRFGSNLNFEVEGEADEGTLPPLALQLLVENAIKHNVISDSHPLRIRVSFKGDYCTVENNVKEKLDKDSTGIGLTNLVERYKYLSDKEVFLNKEADRFVVKIPILKFEHEVHHH